MHLSDCTQGDLLAVRWTDDTDQLVRLCSRPRKSKKEPARVFVLELIDPETMCSYRAGAPELGSRHFNMFAVSDLVVLDVIERRHYGEVEAERDRDADLLDPMSGRRA